jgi:hypothetical protein
MVSTSHSGVKLFFIVDPHCIDFIQCIDIIQWRVYQHHRSSQPEPVHRSIGTQSTATILFQVSLSIKQGQAQVITIAFTLIAHQPARRRLCYDLASQVDGGRFATRPQEPEFGNDGNDDGRVA